jgi:hypothetical protein
MLTSIIRNNSRTGAVLFLKSVAQVTTTKTLADKKKLIYQKKALSNPNKSEASRQPSKEERQKRE